MSSSSISCRPLLYRGSKFEHVRLKTILTCLVGFLHVSLYIIKGHLEIAGCEAALNLTALLILLSVGAPRALCLTFADS